MSEQTCSVRQQMGQQVGLMGMAVNAFLFIIKCMVGLTGNSMAVIADALNNLTDCASSLASVIGFRICGKQADDRHPYGYGRMEYVSGLIVALLIMATALSFGKTAIIRIVQPQAQVLSAGSVWILAAAIAMKLLLALYTDFVRLRMFSGASGSLAGK